MIRKILPKLRNTLLLTTILGISVVPIRYARAGSGVPTVPGIRVLLPDISKMNFGSLPNFTSAGSVNLGSYAQQYLPGDSAISWNAGDTPKNILKLGFFSDSFNLQNLSLDNISQGASNYVLNQFGLIQKQTLDSLIKAIPNLLSLPANSSPPIADLLTSAGIYNLDAPLEEILSTNNLDPSAINLNSLDLSKYKVSDIPGLSSVSLGSLKDWETSTISSIPGLADLPFTQFPQPLALTGAGIGQVDIAFSYKESRRVRTISGSDRAGFNVPCGSNCAGFEVSGNPPINGSFWISGKKPAPWVRGGNGILGSVGGGEEPHGRHPFGKAFKVVITDTNEKKGTVDFSAYMRFCKRGWIDLGCTPYIIGPIPLFPGIKEKTWIPLGASNPTPNEYSLEYVAFNDSVSTDKSAKSGAIDFNTRGFTDNQSLSYLKNSKLDCATRRGISLSLLTEAIFSVEGDYANTGNYTCDAAGNCGRNLGAGKFSSNSDNIRSAIAAKQGGNEFLRRLDKGDKVSGDELLHFLPTYDQKKLLSNSLSLIVEVAFNQTSLAQIPLTTKNVVQRVGEIYFSGSGSKINSNVQNLKGISAFSYGSDVAKYYESNEYLVDSCNHE
jgi:hypothetical protein